MSMLGNQPSVADKYYFCVETLDVIGGRKLRALRPDEDGYYKVPLAVIGEITRNNTFYEPESIIAAITNPKGRFNMALREGTLYGEWGHPSRDATLERIAEVVEDRQSHHIRKVITGETLETGGIPIIGWVKPCGPFGAYLEQNLLGAYTNTSFSLRSIVRGWHDPKMNCQRRAVEHLTTFDAVCMGGYSQASKRYSPAQESLAGFHIAGWERELTPEMFYHNDGSPIACESIKDKYLIDLFGAKEIFFSRQVYGLHFNNNASFIGHDGNKRSVAHAMLGRKRKVW